MLSLFQRLRAKPQSDTGAYSDFKKKYLLTDIVLGTGTYSEVRKGKNKKTGEIVAVKIIDKVGLSAKELRGLQKEVKILQSLEHRNVVKFYDSYEEDDTMYVVMEFVSGGELFQKIVTSDKPYTEIDVRKIIRTLADALYYCKEHGVIHRDIKPQNLLLTDTDGEVKLADFNLSIQVDPDVANFTVLETMCGTPNYVAPEILSGKPYDYKCDIWSLGVITFLLLSGGYLPFFVDEEGEKGKDLLLQKVRRGRWSFYPPEAWENVSEEAKDFLKHTMERNPDKRFDYETMLSHPWLLKDSIAIKPIDVNEMKRAIYKRKMRTVAVFQNAIEIFKEMMELPEKVGGEHDAMFARSGEFGLENLE